MPPPLVRKALTRLVAVYEQELSRVDELLGESTPTLGYELSRWKEKPSRETTTTALAEVARSVRGRAESRARSRAARVCDLDAQRRQHAAHVQWLRPRKPELSSAVAERAAILGRKATPRAAGESAFRRAMRLPPRRRPRGCGTFVLVPASEDSEARAVMDDAVRARSRFEARWNSVASVLVVLEARHLRGRIGVDLATRLRRAAGGESTVGRDQFVRAISLIFDGISERAANTLFSSFDPFMTDRVSSGTFVAAFLAVRPARFFDRVPPTCRDDDDDDDDPPEQLEDLASFLRTACLAYQDPQQLEEEHRLEVDEAHELLSLFAADQSTLAAVLDALYRHVTRPLTTDDLFATLRAAPDLLRLFHNQLLAFRAKVQAAYVDKLKKRNRALADAKINHA